MAINSTFDIQIRYSGDSSYLGAFQAAADRWEQIIVADLPDVNSSNFGFIDDLLIDVSVVSIDGRSGILGHAGPDWIRSNSKLPYHGVMQFDSADMAWMLSSGVLAGTVLHEMGHVLGIGTLWNLFNLIDPNTHKYFGSQALSEYRILIGDGSATFIPLEDGGGPGTANGHWDEEIFDKEIMTGYVESPGTPMPLSRMTIAALADLGYSVNLTAAEPYSVQSAMANHLPIATLSDHALRTNEWAQVNSWLSYSDADGNAVTMYQFRDDGTAANSGYFWTPSNAHNPPGTPITVAAADIANVWVRGGTAGGSETMSVRAFDGTDWSGWDTFTFTTLPNNLPSALINDHSLHTNEWSQVNNWLSYSDADGNAAT